MATSEKAKATKVTMAVKETQAPKSPAAPGATKELQAIPAQVTNAPKTNRVPHASKKSKNPAAPGATQVPKSPAAQVTNTPKANRVPHASKMSKCPAAPQTPKISDLPEAPGTAVPETGNSVSAGTAEAIVAEQKNVSVAASRARFARLIRENMLEAQAHDGGIGTLGEKRMHAVIKNYLADRQFQEIRMDAVDRSRSTRFVADVFDGERIFEVQTGSFYPLRAKLDYYLKKTPYPVTLVHPVSVVKRLSWIDPVTGEISTPRKSPRRGRIQDVAGQLFWLTPYISSGRLSLRLLLCETSEYRWKNGWGRDGKRGSVRYERIPTALLDDVTYTVPEDYRADFLPDTLPERFTAAEYARATRICGMATYGTLGFLTALGLLFEDGKSGRGKAWRRV